MKWFPIALALLACGTAHAQRYSKVDGNRLLGLCTARTTAPRRPGLAPAPSTRLECEAYISGVADGTSAAGPQRATACIPNAVTTAQLVEVVLKDLRSHPENTQLPAGRLVTRALAAAFPCRQ